MTFRGYIKNGRIVVDEPVDLPDGTEVDVRPRAGKPRRSSKQPTKSSGAPKAKKKPRRRGTTTRAGRYAGLIGLLNGLPADFAAQHDHYIHGTPKR